MKAALERASAAAGAMPGMVPGAMPGMVPGAMLGMVPGAMPGMVPGAVPNPLAAFAGVLPGAMSFNPAMAAIQPVAAPTNLATGNGAGAPAPSATPPATADGMAAQATANTVASADGKTKARDFSFLVTEDKQDSGPNLSMLDGSDSDSDSEDAPAEGEGEGEEDGFEAGSAIDQLLWRQKAVSGMETRRPGESVQQFFQRRMAGMRMLKAEAGSHAAKQLESEVDVAIMNANTQWHWSAGDPDADLSDDEGDAKPALGLTGPSGMLELTYKDDSAWELPQRPADGEPPLPTEMPPPPPL